MKNYDRLINMTVDEIESKWGSLREAEKETIFQYNCNISGEFLLSIKDKLSPNDWRNISLNRYLNIEEIVILKDYINLGLIFQYWRENGVFDTKKEERSLKRKEERKNRIKEKVISKHFKTNTKEEAKEMFNFTPLKS